MQMISMNSSGEWLVGWGALERWDSVDVVRAALLPPLPDSSG